MPQLVEFEAAELDPSTLNVLSGNTLVAGAPADEWWSRQSAASQRAFMDTIRTSMRNGESIAQAAARITGGTVNGVKYTGFLAQTRAQANALAATSMSAITNAARLDTYREMNDVIKAVQQVSTLDNRTSDVCIAYSGETWDVDTLEPLGPKMLPFNGGPPRHFNCRSTVIPITKSFEELGLKGKNIPHTLRASMDGQVPADITFDKWLSTKTTPFQNRLLGKRRAELWRQGKITTKELVDQRGNPMSITQLEQLVAGPVSKVAPSMVKSVDPDPPVNESLFSANPLSTANSDELFSMRKSVGDKYEDLIKRFEVMRKSFTQQQFESIMQYLGGGYTYLNGILRGSTFGSLSDEARGMYDRFVSELRGVIKAAPPLDEARVVYRGMAGIPPELNGLVAGDTFSTKGFLSTSEFKYVAHGFMKTFNPSITDHTLFEIFVPKGSKGVLAGMNRSEAEFLFDHGAKFRVLSIRTEKNVAEWQGKNITLVRLVLVP